MESIQQLIRYCLLFWYDNEHNWSIVSSNSIIKPRREPDEYKEGDLVLAKFKGKPYNAAIVRVQDVCPLDLFALTVETQELKSENQQLREQLAKVVLVNENLRREQHKSLEKNSKFSGRETPLSATELNDSHAKNNFKYYTGFVYEQFRHIYSFLVSGDYGLPFTYTKASPCWRTIKVEDQLLLTMIKLRLNFDHKHLSNLFLISQQDSSLIFTNWINFMFFKFGSVPISPHRDVIMEKMPSKFKAEFKKYMVVLDGTEIKIQRPSSLTSQSQCYSDYKSATTLKGLIGVDPSGSVIFISTLFSGSTSDKEISTKSGLLDHLKTLLDCNMLETGDGVMVDKGFNIKDEIEGLGLEFIMPPYASSERQMSAADVATKFNIIFFNEPDLVCLLFSHKLYALLNTRLTVYSEFYGKATSLPYALFLECKRMNIIKNKSFEIGNSVGGMEPQVYSTVLLCGAPKGNFQQNYHYRNGHYHHSSESYGNDNLVTVVTFFIKLNFDLILSNINFTQVLKNEIDSTDICLASAEHCFFDLLSQTAEQTPNWGTRVCNLYDQIQNTKDKILLRTRQAIEWYSLELRERHDGGKSKGKIHTNTTCIKKKKRKGTKKERQRGKSYQLKKWGNGNKEKSDKIGEETKEIKGKGKDK
ncbi:hypothetical protein KUTeg_011738 [Tegillarca granosa]|uniref:DDE Tnp4 domain-containing protein n=1 Tax=Tegillarca granosa TaxID=220873 RepID=A0ABQ9EXJ5_TEGGR|nr:hypothetical protein KUTeg_011738 [Tegillarca granosa]